MARTEKWDRRFLDLAQLVASWSRDPSTKTGAVFVRPDRTVISVGYNGFPRGIADTEARYNDRQVKYSLIVHAEMNALLSAHSDVQGSTLYIWPFLSCDRCCVQLIQAGVKRVVAPICPADKLERWGQAFDTTRALFQEVGIGVTEINIAV